MTAAFDRGDIDALIEDAAEQLEVIRSLYDATLHEREASRRLKTRIKNVLENQRSAIVERHGDPKRHSYYPVAPTPSKFPDAFKRTLPDVKSAKIRKAIETRQPYQAGYEWLADLVTLTNENKHRRLSPQTRREQRRIRAETSGTLVEWSPSNVRFGPGVRIGGVPVNPATQRPVSSPTQTITEIVYVDWLFQEPAASALGTLTRIQDSLPALIDEVLAAAGL